MKEPPSFFLSAASEMRGDLATVRACWKEGRLSDPVRDDYMLIRIEPPILSSNAGGEDASSLIISTRHRGFSLFPITKWPCAVYIAEILDKTILETMGFEGNQVALIGWGMIYRTVAEAELDFEKFVRASG
jgi:hypothetical protein